MKISDEARQVFDEILKSGGEVYIVGGSVRDDYLYTHESHDVDVEIYHMTYQELYDVLSRFGHVYTIGKAFAIMQLDCLKGYDFALPRMETKVGDGHRDFDVMVNPDLPLLKAIQRRDLTMNALMYDYQHQKVIDLCGGIQDIQEGVIRCVNPTHFIEDPLRVLRIASFVARFGMQVEKETKDLCQRMVKDHMLDHLSIERVYEEYSKILMATQPSLGFEFLKEIDALPFYLEDLVHTHQRSDFHPEGNVFNHTMLVIDIGALVKHRTDHPLWFMWSCLLHDIGKPLVTTPEGHAPLHNEAGVEVFKKIDVIQGKKQRAYIETMILYHMHLMNMARRHSADIKYLRLLKNIEGKISLNDLIYISCCDKLGRGYIAHEQYNAFYEYIDDLKLRLGDHALPAMIDGKDLMKRGFQNHQNYRVLLDEAYELQLQGMDRETILRSLEEKYGKR